MKCVLGNCFETTAPVNPPATPSAAAKANSPRKHSLTTRNFLTAGLTKYGYYRAHSMPHETASKGKSPDPYGSHHNAQLKEQNSATHQMPKRYTKRSETLGEMHPTLKSIRHYSDPTDKPFAVDHCTLRHICPIFPFTHPTTQPTMNPPTIPPMTQNVTQYPSTQSTTPRPVTTHPSTQSATAHQLPQNTEAKKREQLSTQSTGAMACPSTASQFAILNTKVTVGPYTTAFSNTVPSTTLHPTPTNIHTINHQPNTSPSTSSFPTTPCLGLLVIVSYTHLVIYFCRVRCL